MKTRTHLKVSHAGDIREFTIKMRREVKAVLEAARQLSHCIDAAKLMVDVGVMILHDVIEAVALEIYQENEIIRAWRYDLNDGDQEEFGPSPDNPPTGPIPHGARVRVVVYPNRNQPAAECDAIFDQLKWTAVDALDYPATVTSSVYGAFRNGGIGAQRTLFVNSRFDSAVESRPSHFTYGREPSR